jgi:Pyruvate/2-oxoacid:ferredoxin oxidoreductase gamma subunit
VREHRCRNSVPEIGEQEGASLAERALLLTGIGGQGIQLAARTIAVAGVAEGLDAMVFGEYGGMMRGGNSDATVVLGTERLITPPTVSHAWGAVVLHHEYWRDVEPRLLSGGVVVVDRSVFRGDVGRSDLAVVDVEATAIASEMGAPQAAAMVVLGALAGATGIVGLEALEAATAEVLPPYRRQHAAANAAAVRSGYSRPGGRVADAWPAVAAEAPR